MNTKQMPVSELKLPERNIRIHTEKQLREYERSIAMFGQLRPIIIDESNVILCGVGMYLTFQRMGQETASVLVAAGLTAKQKKKLMIADNKIYALGIDDLSALDAFLNELQGDYDVPGYDEEVLRTLMADAQDVEDTINAYGTLAQDEIEDMKAAAGRKEEAIEQAQSRAPAPPLTQAETRRSIICPKCGEEIWL